MRNFIWIASVYTLSWMLVEGEDRQVDRLDKLIEDEITLKLGTDLLQSIERKFQVDLEKSVDMVLVKIKLLLSNGTAFIQNKLVELQEMLEIIRKEGGDEVDKCLLERQNETTALAEKALHDMVICGYALIGHDPAQAVTRVMALKNMISQGVQPIYEQKKEVYDLLKVCGHDHESLKKVVKCVISKSTHIKSAMMDITTKLVEGVVDLTKMMAHGAMHEACLIEVIRNTEVEAFAIIKKVRNCARGTESLEEMNKFIADNNATVVDVDLRSNKTKANVSYISEMERRKQEGKTEEWDDGVKQKFRDIKDEMADNKIADW